MRYALLVFAVGIIWFVLYINTIDAPVLPNATPIAYCDDGQIKTVRHEDGRLEHFVCKEKVEAMPSTKPVKIWPCPNPEGSCG